MPPPITHDVQTRGGVLEVHQWGDSGNLTRAVLCLPCQQERIHLQDVIGLEQLRQQHFEPIGSVEPPE